MRTTWDLVKVILYVMKGDSMTEEDPRFPHSLPMREPVPIISSDKGEHAEHFLWVYSTTFDGVSICTCLTGGEAVTWMEENYPARNGNWVFIPHSTQKCPDRKEHAFHIRLEIV